MWAASMRTCKGPLIKGCHPWSLRKCRRRAMRPPPGVRDKVCACRQRERLVRRQGLELLPLRSRRRGTLEPIKHRGPAKCHDRSQAAASSSGSPDAAPLQHQVRVLPTEKWHASTSKLQHRRPCCPLRQAPLPSMHACPRGCATWWYPGRNRPPGRI